MIDDGSDRRGSWFERFVGLVQMAWGGFCIRYALTTDVPIAVRIFILIGAAPFILWGLERLIQRFWSHELVDRWRERRRVRHRREVDRRHRDR